MKPLISKQSKIISIILLLFLVIDLSFTFYQNYNLPLDGDLVPIVAPSEHYSQILKDPFGITVIKEQESYAATNRYFFPYNNGCLF